MSDLDKTIKRLHAKTSITLRRHELLTLASLAQAEADRYLKRARRKNAAPYTTSANIKTAGSFQRLAHEIRTQAETDR